MSKIGKDPRVMTTAAVSVDESVLLPVTLAVLLLLGALSLVGLLCMLDVL